MTFKQINDIVNDIVININNLEKNCSIGVCITIACISLIILRCLLDYLYFEFVTIYFSEFFTFNINYLHLIESYVITIISGLILCFSFYHRPRPSAIFLILLYIVLLLPILVMYGYADAPSYFIYAVSFCYILLTILTDLLPNIRFPTFSYEFSILTILFFLGVSIFNYGWLLWTGGIERFNLDLRSVYTYRAQLSDINVPFKEKLLSLQAKIINPFFMLFGLYLKRNNIFILAIIAQILLFAVTGHKSFLFSPLLFIFIYLIWQRKNPIFFIASGFFFVLAISFVHFLVSGDSLFPSLMIRRVFFVTAYNHIIYYDFFSQPNHPFFMLSSSYLKYFISNPYGEGIGMVQVIAEEVYGRDFSPNAGFLADAYGNFGFPGMILFSFLVSIVLKIIDSVSKNIPAYLSVSIITMPLFALMSSALPTVLFSHGLLILIIILWMTSSLHGNFEKKKSYK